MVKGSVRALIILVIVAVFASACSKPAGNIAAPNPDSAAQAAPATAAPAAAAASTSTATTSPAPITQPALAAPSPEPVPEKPTEPAPTSKPEAPKPPAPAPKPVPPPLTPPAPSAPVPVISASTGVWPTKPLLPGGLLVIVENHTASRPQSGLNRADVVYEADIVAGISRFLLVYYRQPATEIGPVRSARWVFFNLAQGYGLPFNHCGGSVDVLGAIGRAKEKGFPDMDEIYGAGKYFWRSSKRSAPHNLYTSTARLLEGARDRGFAIRAPLELPFVAKLDELPPDGRPATSIRIPYKATGNDANVVSWQYKAGHYIRYTNGKVHALTDGEAVTTENVVVLYTITENVVKYGEPIKENEIIGSGKAQFFVAGKVFSGDWSKPSAAEPLKFTKGGQPFKFATGRVWVNIVDKALECTFGE